MSSGAKLSRGAQPLNVQITPRCFDEGGLIFGGDFKRIG